MGDAGDALVGGEDFVVGGGSAAPGQFEAVTELHPFDGLDAHQGPGEPGIEATIPLDVGAEAGGQTPHDHLDHPAEGVARLAALLDLRRHGHCRLRVEAAGGIGVDGRAVRDARQIGTGCTNPAESDDVADDADLQCLVEESGCHGAKRHPSRGLPGRGAFQYGPRLGEVVLLHPGQVGVTGPGAGERGVASLGGEPSGIHLAGGHHGLPLGPFRVSDHDGDR